MTPEIPKKGSSSRITKRKTRSETTNISPYEDTEKTTRTKATVPPNEKTEKTTKTKAAPLPKEKATTESSDVDEDIPDLYHVDLYDQYGKPVECDENGNPLTDWKGNPLKKGSTSKAALFQDDATKPQAQKVDKKRSKSLVPISGRSKDVVFPQDSLSFNKKSSYKNSSKGTNDNNYKKSNNDIGDSYGKDSGGNYSSGSRSSQSNNYGNHRNYNNNNNDNDNQICLGNATPYSRCLSWKCNVPGPLPAVDCCPTVSAARRNRAFYERLAEEGVTDQNHESGSDSDSSESTNPEDRSDQERRSSSAVRNRYSPPWTDDNDEVLSEPEVPDYLEIQEPALYGKRKTTSEGEYSGANYPNKKRNGLNKTIKQEDCKGKGKAEDRKGKGKAPVIASKTKIITTELPLTPPSTPKDSSRMRIIDEPDDYILSYCCSQESSDSDRESFASDVSYEYDPYDHNSYTDKVTSTTNVSAMEG
ncbi:hypothetical protein BGZ49_001818, partial [Haplosporangium sp. Z 27]